MQFVNAIKINGIALIFWMCVGTVANTRHDKRCKWSLWPGRWNSNFSNSSLIQKAFWPLRGDRSYVTVLHGFFYWLRTGWVASLVDSRRKHSESDSLLLGQCQILCAHHRRAVGSKHPHCHMISCWWLLCLFHSYLKVVLLQGWFMVPFLMAAVAPRSCRAVGKDLHVPFLQGGLSVEGLWSVLGTGTLREPITVSAFISAVITSLVLSTDHWCVNHNWI